MILGSWAGVIIARLFHFRAYHRICHFRSGGSGRLRGGPTLGDKSYRDSCSSLETTTSGLTPSEHLAFEKNYNNQGPSPVEDCKPLLHCLKIIAYVHLTRFSV